MQKKGYKRDKRVDSLVTLLLKQEYIAKMRIIALAVDRRLNKEKSQGGIM